ncbi:MAG: hypothetical protein ACPLYF_00505, partial [Fervidobacterium sp.]
SLKGVFDMESHLLEVKRGLLSRDVMRFEVNPEHIYSEVGFLNKKRDVVYLDNANRKSIEIKRWKEIIEDGKKRTEPVTETVQVGTSIQLHNDDPIDMAKANTLDFHVERSFWKALMQSTKIPLSTIIIMLLAGVGIYHFLVLILRIFGVNV